jgi:hypothetical protein
MTVGLDWQDAKTYFEPLSLTRHITDEAGDPAHCAHQARCRVSASSAEFQIIDNASRLSAGRTPQRVVLSIYFRNSYFKKYKRSYS